MLLRNQRAVLTVSWLQPVCLGLSYRGRGIAASAVLLAFGHAVQAAHTTVHLGRGQSTMTTRFRGIFCLSTQDPLWDGLGTQLRCPAQVKKIEMVEFLALGSGTL